MNKFFRYIFLLASFVILSQTAAAQFNTWGDTDNAPRRTDVRTRNVRIGVMLPIDNTTDEGRHMTEYYRGLLMACDSLRMEGISTDVKAWNVGKTTSVESILSDSSLADLDLIIGPYYGKHMKTIADFAATNGIKMLLPYSVDTNDSFDGRTVFYANHSHEMQTALVTDNFIARFDTCHIVIVNCNDKSARKEAFIKDLQIKLRYAGMNPSITSLNASDSEFEAAFRKDKHNVVVVNTGLSQDLNIFFARLNTLTINAKIFNNRAAATGSSLPIAITLFGQTEWLAFTSQNLSNYYKYDTYIPSTFYMNPLSPQTARMNLKYRWNFHDDMENALPRFAMTGFDHAYFFIKGLKRVGTDFDGRRSTVNYLPMQTPMSFKPLDNGGFVNMSYMLIHYTPEYDIETYTY